MVRKEKRKMVIAALIGFIYTLITLIQAHAEYPVRWNHAVSLLLFSPVYSIGLLYGAKSVLRMLIGLLKLSFPLSLMFGRRSYADRGFVSGIVNFFVVIILFVLLLSVVSVIGWIMGLIIGGNRLDDDQRTDDGLDIF